MWTMSRRSNTRGSLTHLGEQRRLRSVALSRAVFSARFTRLVGEPPITYLTRWRMYRATRLLKNNVEVEKIAELLGYESEVAFRKAFKREVGMPPARYRKLGEPVSTTWERA